MSRRPPEERDLFPYGKRLSPLSRWVVSAQEAASCFLDRKVVFAGLAVLTALLTTIAYTNTTREYPFGSILRVTLGVADSPFQSRILTYAAARAISDLLSINLYTVHFFLRLGIIAAVLYALRALAKTLGFRSGFLLLLFPWSVMFSFASDYHYPTDFTEILFFALMLLLALKGRWSWLLPVFTLAFLNRESAVLILPFLGFQFLALLSKITLRSSFWTR